MQIKAWTKMKVGLYTALLACCTFMNKMYKICTTLWFHGKRKQIKMSAVTHSKCQIK